MTPTPKRRTTRKYGYPIPLDHQPYDPRQVEWLAEILHNAFQLYGTDPDKRVLWTELPERPKQVLRFVAVAALNALQVSPLEQENINLRKRLKELAKEDQKE